MSMYEKAIILARSIDNDLETISQLYQAINNTQLTDDNREKGLIDLAYSLNKL